MSENASVKYKALKPAIHLLMNYYAWAWIKIQKNKMIRIACQTFYTECNHTEYAQNKKSWSYMNYFIQNENNKTSYDKACMVYIYSSTDQLELKLYRHEHMTKTEFNKQT